MQNDFEKQNSNLNSMFQSSYPEAREKFRNNLRSEVIDKLAVSTNSQVVGSDIKNIPTKITKLMSFYKKLLAGAIAAVAIIAIFLGVNSLLISTKNEPFAISKVSAMIEETLKNYIYVRKYTVVPGKDYAQIINDQVLSSEIAETDKNLSAINNHQFKISEYLTIDNKYFSRNEVDGNISINVNGEVYSQVNNSNDLYNYLQTEPSGIEYLKNLINNGKANVKITKDETNSAELTLDTSYENGIGRIYVFDKKTYNITETRYFLTNKTGSKLEFKIEKYTSWEKLDDNQGNLTDIFQLQSSANNNATTSNSISSISISSSQSTTSSSINSNTETSTSVIYNLYQNMQYGEKCGTDGVSEWVCASGLSCDTGDNSNTGGGVIGICSVHQ